MRSLKHTIVFKVNSRHPEKKILEYAAAAIRAGRLVAFPTETVYGIAANRLDKKAMALLKRAKKRPKGKPFTVHISETAMMRKLGCHPTKKAKKLINRFWPGPLTILLRSKTGEKIGFRMPANKVALGLIDEAKVPVVAPSANISGSPAPTKAGEVLKELDGKIDIILDAGPTKVGVESTVVDLTVSPPKILREGAIDKEKLVKVLGL